MWSLSKKESTMIESEVRDLEYWWNNRILTKYRQKIFKTLDGRIVIEIEQNKISQGTTITNTIDLIARQTIDNLKDKYFRKSKYEYFNNLIDLIPFKIMDILKFILKKITNYTEFNNSLKSIIWIEHYPANVYFFKEDKYAIVTFENKYINPNWFHYSKEELAKKINCDLNQL